MARVKNNKAAITAAGAKALKQELIRTANPVGRPSLRTPEVESEIFTRLTNGEDMVAICQDAHMPGRSTVCAWMESDPAFRAKIKDAFKLQVAFMIGMGWDILRGGEYSTGNVERDKAQVGYLRFLLGKFDRDWFGEQIKVEQEIKSVIINQPDEINQIIIDSNGKMRF